MGAPPAAATDTKVSIETFVQSRGMRAHGLMAS